MRRAGWLVASVLAAGLLGACSKAGESTPSASVAPGATAAEGVTARVAAWQAAGLAPGTFAAADGSRYGGGTCQAGAVSGVEVVLCRHADAAAAKAAQAIALGTVGDATGLALVHDTEVLVVADRDRKDPEGRAINTLAKTFKK